MTRSGIASFDEWENFCFRDRSESWHTQLDDHDLPWLGRDDRVPVEYFTRLHETAPVTLERFSNEEIGAGLWALYSSASELHPSFHLVPRQDRHRAIRSVGAFVTDAVPERLSPGTQDILHHAVYMFWDIAAVWPHGTGPYEDEDRAVCIEEMRGCLYVDHPTARYHALHGLGHFVLIAGDDAAGVIDEWLDTSPAIDAAMAEYAARARAGSVQ